MIRGRNKKAKVNKVIVAVAPIKINVSSSIPKVEPNRKLFKGIAEPAEDKMKIPRANEIR